VFKNTSLKNGSGLIIKMEAIMKINFTKRILSSCIATIVVGGVASATFAQEDSSMVEEVVVTGTRASLEQSIDVKRNAASVVDVITAEDIGKLPDTTIADSLQRVTGVQIQRSAGEGSRINVRGSSSVALMLNGEQFLSAGNISGVQPDLTDIPSTMVSALEVLKTTTSSVLTGGLTGTVDLQTHRPLKLKDGLTMTGQINTGTGSRTKTTDGGVQGFAGYNADTWGAALNASYSDVTLADDYAGSNGDEGALWWGMPNEGNSLPSAGDDINKDGISSNFLASQGFGATSRENQRKRLAVNASFQAELSDALTLTTDIFYTDMEQSRRQRGFRVEGAWSNNWSNPTFGPLREAPDGATYSDFYSTQEFQFNAKRASPNSNERLDERDSLNTNFELKWDNGGAFSGTARYIHGEANNDSVAFEVDSYMTDGSQHNGYSNFPDGRKELINVGGYHGTPALDSVGNPAVDGDGNPVGNAVVGSVKYGSNGMTWTLPSDLGSDISQYGLVSNHLSGQKGEATLDAFRFDGNFKTDAGILASIDFGARSGKRKVDYKDWINIALLKNQNGTDYGIRWKDADGNAPYLKSDLNQPAEGESSYYNIKFTDPRISQYVVKEGNFPGVSGVNPMYFLDASKMDGRAFTNMLFPNNFDYADPGQSFAVEEKTQTLYTQFNLEGDIASIPYSGNIGVRYVRTELETSSHEVGDKEDGVTTYTYDGKPYLMGSGWDQLDKGIIKTPNKYNDVLPAINMAFNVTDDQIVRFGYNENMATYDLGTYGRGLKVWRLFDSDTGIFKVDRADQTGNPTLPPARTTNVDLSYEWYFDQGALFSAAAFYRENETATRNGVTYRSDLRDSDGVIRNTNVRTTVLESVKGGESKGFELGFQQPLTFLPGALSNLGWSANYTYSPSEGSQLDFYGNKAPEGNNSQDQANLVLWYDDNKLTARVAYNWRSKRLDWVSDVWGTPLSVYQTESEDLSASIGYSFTDQVTVRFDATNLTKDAPIRYMQWEDQIDKYFFTEARYNLSLQVRY
jgi:iron complex outermembrane receptor protein